MYKRQIGHRAITEDLKLFGLDHLQGDEVRERAAEALDLILEMWQSEGEFSFKGKYFDINAPALDPVRERGFHMRPLQQPHPPIFAAARNAITVSGILGSTPTILSPFLILVSIKC